MKDKDFEVYMTNVRKIHALEKERSVMRKDKYISFDDIDIPIDVIVDKLEAAGYSVVNNKKEMREYSVTTSTMSMFDNPIETSFTLIPIGPTEWGMNIIYDLHITQDGKSVAIVPGLWSGNSNYLSNIGNMFLNAAAQKNVD